MQTENGAVGHDVQVSSDVSDQAPGPSGEPTGRGAAARPPTLVAPSLDDPVVNAASDAVGGPLGVARLPAAAGVAVGDQDGRPGADPAHAAHPGARRGAARAVLQDGVERHGQAAVQPPVLHRRAVHVLRPRVRQEPHAVPPDRRGRRQLRPGVPGGGRRDDGDRGAAGAEARRRHPGPGAVVLRRHDVVPDRLRARVRAGGDRARRAKALGRGDVRVGPGAAADRNHKLGPDRGRAGLGGHAGLGPQQAGAGRRRAGPGLGDEAVPGVPAGPAAGAVLARRPHAAVDAGDRARRW